MGNEERDGGREGGGEGNGVRSGKGDLVEGLF